MKGCNCCISKWQQHSSSEAFKRGIMEVKGALTRFSGHMWKEGLVSKYFKKKKAKNMSTWGGLINFTQWLHHQIHNSTSGGSVVLSITLGWGGGGGFVLHRRSAHQTANWSAGLSAHFSGQDKAPGFMFSQICKSIFPCLFRLVLSLAYCAALSME